MIRRIINGLPLSLSILALMFSIGAFLYQVREVKTRTLVIDAAGSTQELGDDDQMLIAIDPDTLNETLANIEQVREETQSAADAASFVLSFLEGGSILLGALVAIAVIAFGSSIQDVRSRVDESVAEADKRLALSEGRMEELVESIQKQVQISIDNAEQRLQSSESRMEGLTARIEESIKETESTVQGLHDIVNKAVEGAKHDAENSFRVLSLLLLAEQQVRARNRMTAIATLQEAYQIDQKNQTTNYLLGYLYVGRKQFDTAIQHLQRALEIDPNFAPALAAMGLAQRRMGDAERDVMKRRQLWAQAELNLSRALESDPSLIDADNESYFGTLGGLYRRQGRNQEALRAYEDAVKITPNNSYPVGNLALLYKKLNYEDEAKHMYERVIEISEAILDDHPGDTWARLDLAQAILVTGQKSKALAQYKNVIDRLSESGPLEAAHSGLEFLIDAPEPIDGIKDAMQLLTDAISKLHPEGEEEPGERIAPTRYIST